MERRKMDCGREEEDCGKEEEPVERTRYKKMVVVVVPCRDERLGRGKGIPPKK